jgi:hypothetical protein
VCSYGNLQVAKRRAGAAKRRASCAVIVQTYFFRVTSIATIATIFSTPRTY